MPGAGLEIDYVRLQFSRVNDLQLRCSQRGLLEQVGLANHTEEKRSSRDHNSSMRQYPGPRFRNADKER